MAVEKLPDRPPEQEVPRETSGEYLLRVLRPAGAVFVLVLLALFLVICFTYRHDPVKDYTPEHAAAFYAADPAALAREIRDNLLRYLPPCEVEVREGRVKITAAPEALDTLRETLTALFGGDSLVFVEAES